MKAMLAVINRMQADGFIGKYAIRGAVGATFYLEPSATLDIDLFVGGNHGAIVIPYRSDLSHLIFHINYDTLLAPVSDPHMPYLGFNLPLDQLNILMRWINEGAATAVTARGRQ